MVYRLPGERIRLDLDGPTVEVERIAAPAIRVVVMRDVDLYFKADGEAAQVVALVPVYERFIAEAQPTWDISDHRGPIPVTSSGMLRLGELGVRIIVEWVQDSVRVEEVPQSAVDAIIPPGKLNTDLKRRLRSVKAA